MALSENTLNELERLSDQVAQENVAKERRRAEAERKNIRVWVCPKCPHFYGSSNMPSLAERTTGGRGMNGEYTPQEERPMTACPECWQRGELTERKLVVVAVALPE